MGWSEGSGSSGRGWDCCYADRLALDVVHLCKKNQKEEGPAGASDLCHGRVSGINKICIRSSSYCRSQATAA